MASAKDVTVVIPCSKDHLPFISRAAASAGGSGAGEVIIANDGFRIPSDNIPDLHDRFRVINFLTSHMAYGVCALRNTLISEAQNNLILPLDADDYLLPGAVERMAEVWQPGTVVYGGWQQEERCFSTEPDPCYTPMMAPPPGMLPRKHICHATYLFAKADWQRVGGYDPDFNLGAEDWEFMIALVEAGCTLVRLDGDPLYVKTIGDNARTHKAVRRKDLIRQLLLEKHPNFFSNPR